MRHAGGIDPRFWAGRKVLVTGHTGFKGAWLAAWLTRLGADVAGLALAPEGKPNLWTLLKLDGQVRSHIADINDPIALSAALGDGPEIVVHLAAQSLVRRSYRAPVETFAANVLGVVSLLQAIARTPSVRAVIIATSDKCYENDERGLPYAEHDRLGGHDPYSASKGCAEIAAASMRRSFFLPFARDGHAARIATVRAGNVIGGGDWSEDRLVPDIVRGCLGPENEVTLRAPNSVRPWQHVLEPLRGYLMLAERLAAEDGQSYAAAWNFGPGDAHSVSALAAGIVAALGNGRVIEAPDEQGPHEAQLLRLDTRQAADRLGWRPALDFAATRRLTAEWYSRWAAGADPAMLTALQIDDYTAHLVQANADRREEA